MIGERLAEIRKDHGDTQQTLADKLRITKYTVSSWEQEKSEPNHEMLVTICRLYDVSSDYLLGLSNVDPVYLARKIDGLSPEDQTILQEVREYLLWRERKSRRESRNTQA